MQHLKGDRVDMKVNVLWSKSPHFRVVFMHSKRCLTGVLQTQANNEQKAFVPNSGGNISTGCKAINSYEFNWAVQL